MTLEPGVLVPLSFAASTAFVDGSCAASSVSKSLPNVLSMARPVKLGVQLNQTELPPSAPAGVDSPLSRVAASVRS